MDHDKIQKARAREPVTPTSNVQVRRRSRTTPAVSVSVEAHREQEVVPETRQKSHRGFLLVSKWLIGGLLFLLILIFVSTSRLVSSWSRFLHFASSINDSTFSFNLKTGAHLSIPNLRRLDIPLNPQNHTHRPSARLEYEWIVTADFRRPDGVKKRVYLVNGAFPGPTIEARSADTLKITVINSLDKDEDIAIHWHGLWMRNANDMDGAVGFTQCPIRPGERFTYDFKISNDQHGTFWYHAHDQVQRADGLLGGLVVHKPSSEPGAPRGLQIPDYDSESLLLISDWYHRSGNDVMKWYMRAGSFGNEPVPDSIIVNHGGAYNCADAVRAIPIDCVQIQPSELPRIEVDSGKRHRFRVVNTGTLAGFTMRFSGASILPLQVDGGNSININGSVESVGILYPGERVDLLVSWFQSSDASLTSFDIELDDENFKYPNPALTHTHQFPVLVNTNTTSSEQTNESPGVGHFSLVSATSPKAVSGFDAPEVANVTFVVYATTLKLARLSNVPYGFMNHTSWKPQENPALPLISIPRSQWDKNQLVPNVNSSHSNPVWVDLVVNNLDDGSHPFHLHGYDFWVLSIHSGGSSYWGSYDPFDAPDGPPGGPYNLVNPVKKDTVFVPRRGYVVIRFLADNEGVWMFHCHILWHQASGMAMGFQIGLDDEKAAPINSLNLSDQRQLRTTCERK